uniref:Neprilysin n=1 Tax=Hemiscolopendra marginata TaxID=943146 RepID=A0A646QFM4_9MYRI
MSVKMESSQTYLTNKHESNNSCWTNRTRTEKRLLLWILVLIPIVIALVIAVAVISNDYNKLKLQQGGQDSESSVNGSNICLTPACINAASILLSSINLTVDPCDDFYTFACGGWMKHHSIPDEKSRIGSFDILDEETSEKYKVLLGAPADETDSDATVKAKKMYSACLDQESVFKVTMSSILNDLKKFGNWPIITSNWAEKDFDWISMQAALKRTPPSPTDAPSVIVSIDVTFDAKNTSQNIIYFDQPSLGLNRDYLLNPQNYSRVIDAFKTLVRQVATEFAKLQNFTVDKDRITLDVEEMIDLQTNIAKISLPPADKRKKDLIYHKMTIEELNNITKNEIDWLRLTNIAFNNITDITKMEPVVVNDKNYVIQMVDLLNSTSPRAIANYMMWRFMHPLLKHMSRDIQQYYFEYSQVLTGVASAKPRWKDCTGEIDEGLGMALGSMFVKKYFSEKSKQEAERMIEDIRSEFLLMLNTVDWMDEKTREAAIEKGKSIVDNIGYPDWILKPNKLDEYFKEVTITTDNYYLDLRSTAERESLEIFSSLRDQPVDKTKWYMTPGTVNAYYSAELNSINFPAGILQNPFYSEGNPMALNYGGIGSVIGHEITHGFDDEGRLYDKEGNLDKWWSPDVTQQFSQKAQCYVDQYGSFCPPELKGLCLNGNLTLGENIADNGGIKSSYKAYQEWVKRNGEELRLPGLEKFSMEKVFFLGFGQVWCAQLRTEYLLNAVFKDPHSPPKYRVLGTISNSEDFASVFKCPKGTPMNRGNNRCQLW